MALSRHVIEPKNPALGQSQKFGLPLSPAARGGDFVFVSGMAAIDRATGAPAHDTVAADTRQILTNISKLLSGRLLARQSGQGQCAAASSSRPILPPGRCAGSAVIYSMLEYENMNSV